ncbi:exonuclease domain-containing protein [Roseospira goensis]|uniref:DNA polymerase-3 subunit epsilon n=1 Tax=Roseospira goensis TaxID=391922 RepID=A0A7W6RZI4_9PROT|nr:exonuclease domain-containing protein [Roseospira goensis]MBB4286103.1 DNA polymerase-3 subunit epsilon [Roseospira goensis]
MLRHLLGFDMTRRMFWLMAKPGPLRDYYRMDYATLDTAWCEVDYLAIDLETTGLDPTKHEILSFGFVPIRDGAVRLGEARHLLVRPTRPIPEETAVIHGLLDGHLESAPPLDAVLPEVLEALSGRVPVAHYAPVERRFLTAACQSLYGLPLTVPYVDTLRLESRMMERAQRSVVPGTLRLNAARERYGLPRYKAHNAMMDAIAAAELFLAQVDHMGTKKPPRLDELATG